MMTFLNFFLRWLAPISTFRFSYGDITNRVMDLIDYEQNEELIDIKKKAEESGDCSELLEIASLESAELSKKNRELRNKITELEDELATAKSNIDCMTQINKIEDSQIHKNENNDVIDSVISAVKKAKTDFSDTLIFLEDALDSAIDSPYKQHEKVYNALSAMSDICKIWRNKIQSGERFGGFEKLFSEKGFTYKAKESKTAKSRWENEYYIQYKGNKVSIEQHIALGAGGPDTCLRIHFYRDGQSNMFVIGHVGRHKTNTKS